MNRIDTLFRTRKEKILSVYFTAGFPSAGSTAGIIKDLADAGADMIEIGIPFSDPLADGPVIQHSSETALRSGMSINLLFQQLKDIRKEVNIPLVIMSYINPVLKFGIEEFCMKCTETGIDGMILPDLPPEFYREKYRDIIEEHGLYNILLISPQTSDERIRMIDSISKGFIYLVSSSSTTGIRRGFSEEQTGYFRRIREMNLVNPIIIGFGISDRQTFRQACQSADGAIIGSAFIKVIGEKGAARENIREFIETIKSDKDRR